MSTKQTERTATLYRMVMPDHACPHGLKARALPKRRGYAVDDRWLRTRAEVDAFKAEHGVKTTPQTFIDGERIGGYHDLRRHFGIKVRDPEAVSYVLVLAVSPLRERSPSPRATRRSTPLSPCEPSNGSSASRWSSWRCSSFRTSTNSRRCSGTTTCWPRIGCRTHRSPFAEFVAGTLMAAHALDWLSIPLALFIGTIGAVSVFYAVYVQKRELKCA